MGIVVDESRNVYVTGTYSETVNFGGGNRTNSGSKDIFVLKLNSSGAHIWDYTKGGTSIDEGRDIALDENGNIFVAGIFDDTVNFGGGNRTVSSHNYFLLKLNSSGTYIWDNIESEKQYDYADNVEINKDGYIYLSGQSTTSNRIYISRENLLINLIF